MKKILYLSSFTVKNSDFTSSDAIGYGITSSDALFTALQHDFKLLPVPSAREENTDRTASLAWTLRSYQDVLHYLQTDPPDAIFIFHSFQQFPQEIKKMLYHLNLTVPVIGYTHGSHWDPTDTFRQIHSPGLHLTDLANLYCLDAILFVTHTFKAVVINEIAQFQPEVAKAIAAKSFVVGLPINTPLIDSFYRAKKSDELTIVFNHAPVPSKNVGLFLEVIGPILAEYPHIKCHITRQSPAGSADDHQAQSLLNRYGGRLTLSRTLPIADYYRALWESDIQVSTATHESLGVATLEAMYTGNCCILPNIGAYAEISGPAHEHLYTDKNELIHKLKFYIENAAARKKVAGELTDAAKKYSMDYLYPRFVGVINQTL